MRSRGGSSAAYAYAPTPSAAETTVRFRTNRGRARRAPGATRRARLVFLSSLEPIAGFLSATGRRRTASAAPARIACGGACA